MNLKNNSLIKSNFGLKPGLGTLAALVVGLIPSTYAVDRLWTAGTGAYGTPTNWSGNVVPTADDNAIINNGGTAQLTSGSRFVTNLRVASGSGTSGILTLSGTGALTVNGEGWVGDLNNAGGTANGTLNLQDSASLTVENWFAIGRFNGHGTLNVSGGTLTKGGGVGGAITISTGSSNGTVNHSGGTIINTLTPTWLGENGSGTAVWNATGGTANLAFFEVRREGSGTSVFNISGTAVYQVANVAVGSKGTMNFNGGSFAANSFTGVTGAKLNFDGGTIVARQNTAGFFGALPAASLEIKAGGLTFDTGIREVTVAQGLGGAGGLTKKGSGTLTLGGANTYQGDTNVEAGTLILWNTVASQNIRISGGATLDTDVDYELAAGKAIGGVGTGTATVKRGIITQDATSRIGIHDSATGTLVLAGDDGFSLGLDATQGATFVFDLNGTLSNDVLSVAGLTIDGTINIELYNLGMGTLQAGVVYDLIVGSGTWVDEGANFVFTTIPNEFVLDETYGDGGYLFDPADRSFSVRFAMVPEPSIVACLAVAMAMLLIWHRRNRSQKKQNCPG